MIKGTSLLRENNRRKVLSLIRQLEETSRQDLVKLMSVSKNTISLIVDEFIKEGILEEIGIKEPGKIGRPEMLIKVNKNHFRSIGFSISKVGITYKVVNYYGDRLEKEFIAMDCRNSLETKEKLFELIDNLIGRYDNIIGIGIGIPGIVNSDDKLVHTSTHLGWKSVSLQELDQYNVPIHIQNSVNMGAIDALNKEGHFEGESSFYVRIGEGVGGAFYFNKSIMEGNSWTAGEIGHIAIDQGGEQCDCGQRGCLELLVNHGVFQKKLEKLGLTVSVKDEEFQFTPELLEAEKAKKIISSYGEYLGKALVQVIHLINPTNIIIDTSYVAYGVFQERCREYMENNALNISYSETNIIFGNRAYSLCRGSALSSIMNYEQGVNKEI